MTLIPTGMEPPAFAILAVASFFTSLMTASLGIGGGVTLLAIMAQILPAPALIPVHAVVQLGSNAGRAGLMLRHINWGLLLYFSMGALVGAAIGGRAAIALPTDALLLILGLFILFAIWGPKPPAWTKGKWGLGAQGAISSMLTMFVGATGPFVAAALKPHKLPPLEHIGSFSAAMVIQHGLKIAAFGLLGFVYGPYMGLIGVMLATGFLGTYCGRLLLNKIKPEFFHLMLNILLSLLALRLIHIALFD